MENERPAPLSLGSTIWYQQDFITAADEDTILDALTTLPLRNFEDYDPRAEFAFTRLEIDGFAVTGRLEAAAGTPIWWNDRSTSGTPLPTWAADLAARLDTWIAKSLGIATHQAFTSIYVDSYEAGGTFVPHVDRECYGLVIAGVSVGPGECNLRFTSPGSDPESVDLTLAPRSAYVFTGRFRNLPWRHEIRQVTDRRYGLTFRTEHPTLRGATPLQVLPRMPR